VPNCRPIGLPNFTTLLAGLRACLELAHSGRVAGPDVAAVQAGVAKATELCLQGFRVETNPMGSHAYLPDASMWSLFTSWPLGQQMETTRNITDVGTSRFPVQEGPYVCHPDGSTVPTFQTALLAPNPSDPPFAAVHLNDVWRRRGRLF